MGSNLTFFASVAQDALAAIYTFSQRRTEASLSVDPLLEVSLLSATVQPEKALAATRFLHSDSVN
jgi:hypothetical protein